MASGFGATIWCDSSVKTGRYARGAKAVALSLFRRFSTPPGTLRGPGQRDDATELAFGFDVAGYVGAIGDEAAVRALPEQMRAQAAKDERVLDSNVSVSANRRPDGMVDIVINMRVILQDERGEFTLTLAVGDGLLTLIGVS